MKITTQTTERGEVKFIAVISGRRYIGRCPGYNIPEARQRFRKRVELAERKLMDKIRKRIIDTCLHCTVPVEQCKGNCNIKQSIKVRRGKGVK